MTRDGRIFCKKTNREYIPSNDAKGYKILRLPYIDSTNKDKRRPFKVHRLVAMFYLDDYSEDLQVNHKNGNKADNRVENLEMVTNQQNTLHAWRKLDSSKRRKLIGDSNRRRDLSNFVEAGARKNRKKTAKLDDSGNVLAVYDSLLQAAESVNVVFSAIGNAIAHKTKSAGFYWKYL